MKTLTELKETSEQAPLDSILKSNYLWHFNICAVNLERWLWLIWRITFL